MADLVQQADRQRSARIRELNDAFRRTLAGGKLVLTVGVNELPEAVRSAVIEAVRAFDDEAFDKANDPYGEHDFVAFEIEGQTYFAKIDYYDISLSGGSEDPADPEKTTRILTIMRADEY